MEETKEYRPREVLTYTEIAQRLGLSKVRCQQLHDRALRKLAKSPELRALAVDYGLVEDMTDD